jgi:hypothetical protein
VNGDYLNLFGGTLSAQSISSDSYFPAQNSCFWAGGQWPGAQQIPPGFSGGLR